MDLRLKAMRIAWRWITGASLSDSDLETLAAWVDVELRERLGGTWN